MRGSIKPIGSLFFVSLFWAGFAGGQEVPRETIHFAFDYLTSPGDSLFIKGSLPELGNNSLTQSIKMVPGVQNGSSLPWTLDISIPQGATFTYQYFRRNDDVVNWKNAANGTSVSGVLNGATSTPSPPTRDLVMYAFPDDGATRVIFNTPGGSFARRLLPIPGRTDLTCAVMVNQLNGRGTAATIGSFTTTTPLHTSYYRTNNIYNYEPDANVVQNYSIVTFAYPSALIPATRTVNGVTGRGVQVCLPRGYGQHPDRRYPVLYMHDGQNVFAPGGPFGCWFAEQSSSHYAARGQVRELIIVAIDNSSARLEEYNPEYGNPTPNAKYNQFVVSELKPYVDANYRTLTEQANTGVLGSSFGAIAALSLAFNYPAVFGQVGAMSPSYWASSFDNRLAAGQLNPAIRFYEDAGDTSDDGDITLGVRDALLKTGRVLDRDLFFMIGFNQQHNEAAWSARLPYFYLSMFPITDEAPALAGLGLPIPGDVNSDGCVDLSDAALLISAYGTCEGQPGFNPPADPDGSTCIDLTDLATLLSNYGGGCQ